MQTATKPAKRRAGTQYLRIPQSDWALVTLGHKTEFRNVGRHAPTPEMLVKPSPLVCWTSQHFSEPRYALMVLLDCWTEPLGSISPDSLEREGFQTIDEFRRYWRNRHKGVLASYKPLSDVQVYHLRPWRPSDDVDMGRALLTHLYGGWLPDA